MRPAPQPNSPVARRRWGLVALGCLLAGVALATLWRAETGDLAARSPSKSASPRPTSPAPEGTVRILLGLKSQATIRPEDGVDAAIRALTAALPKTRTLRIGSALVTYRLDARVTARRAVSARSATVQVARRPVASRIAAPVVAQKLANNCETASLSTLLATRGVDAPQLELQAALPRSGPLDPDDSGNERTWGDPARGYVGRPDGGGVAGGFGVYQRPVAAVAQRRGVKLRDLTGKPPSAVYERVRAGRAVMVWIGLSSGPYGEWRSPNGRKVRVNFGEHTVVLNGIGSDGRLRVVNPLRGTAETWTKSDF